MKQKLRALNLIAGLTLSANHVFADYKAQTCYKSIQFNRKQFQVVSTGFGPTTGVNVPGSSLSNCCGSVDEVIREQFSSATVLNNGNCYPGNVLAIWKEGRF